MKILKSMLAERSMGKKNENNESSAFSYACSQTGFRLLPPSPETQHPSRLRMAPMCLSVRCSCYLYSSWHRTQRGTLFQSEELLFWSTRRDTITRQGLAVFEEVHSHKIFTETPLVLCKARRSPEKPARHQHMEHSPTLLTEQSRRCLEETREAEHAAGLQLCLLFVGIQRGKAGPRM